MTAQLIFDGTFSCDAVAATAHTVVQQLHDEAMTTIAALAENWDQPVEDAAPADDEPVTYADPASWSVDDDEDEQYGENDDEVRVLPVLELPALLPHPRRATATANVAASATTDEFAVPAERLFAAS